MRTIALAVMLVTGCAATMPQPAMPMPQKASHSWTALETIGVVTSIVIAVALGSGTGLAIYQQVTK